MQASFHCPPILRQHRPGLRQSYPASYPDCFNQHGALLAFYEEHDSSSATCPGTPAEPENTPSGIKRLQDEYGSIVNFERCYELSDYDSKTATFAPDGRHLEERATTLHKFLRDRKEEEIVVVSLGQFLHYVSRDVDDDGKQIHGDWENTEYRSYIFWPVGHEDALLKEMLC